MRRVLETRGMSRRDQGAIRKLSVLKSMPELCELSDGVHIKAARMVVCRADEGFKNDDG